MLPHQNFQSWQQSPTQGAIVPRPQDEPHKLFIFPKSQHMSKNADFTPPPQYSQTTTSNETYTSVVTTRTDSDGSVSQSLQIISKR